MRTAWVFHRRLVVAIAGVVLVSSAGVVVATSINGVPHTETSAAIRAAVRPTPAVSTPESKRQANPKMQTKARTSSQHHLRPTSTINPPETAIQIQIDTELAQAETPASIAAAKETSVPDPATSAAYPAIPGADRSDPTAYAIAFATELLDTNYTTQSRAALLAWAEHEEAPNTLPGVPGAVGGKALVLSIADPGLPGGTPSPTPSAPEWARLGTSHVVQSVSDVQAEVDPDWTQIISEGWQPRDPLMTIDTVTGTMTVKFGSQAAPPESFSLTLTLGSAAHVHAGYGAVAVGNWTLD